MKNERQSYTCYRQLCSDDDYRQSLIDEFNYNDKELEKHIKLIEKSEKDALDYYLSMPDKDAKIKNHIFLCYLYEYGTEKNLTEVLYWLKKLKPKDPGIQFCVAYAYEFGLSIPKNVNKAFKWYRKSARQGNQEAIERLDLWF